MENFKKQAIIAGVLAAFVCSAANAATFNVTKTADTRDGSCDTDCSLREAIDAANASPGLDVINLPAGEYKITRAGANEDANATGDFDILDDLEIRGSGSSTTSISGEGAFKILDVNGVSSPISLLVSDVTLKYANLAALDFYGTGNLDVENAVFTKNYNQYGYGASIEVRGWPTLTVNDSLFTDNCATSAPAIDGEGVWSINNSTFSNHGGWFESPFVTGADCKIDAWGGGGTMYLQATNATITGSSFINNTADGGGAIHVYNGSLDVINSTFSNNTADNSKGWGYGGGAIEYDNWNTITGTIKNSTIVNNQAPASSGGGIKVGSRTTLTVENSIIASNGSPTGTDCVGAVTSVGNTLLGDATGCSYIAGAGDLSGAPGLDSYTDDGTPGNGHFPLLATSQAVDAGNNTGCAASDQLGTVRPVDGDSDGIAICDIGAVEFVPVPALLAVNDSVTTGSGLTYIDVMSNDTMGSVTTIIKSVGAVSPAVGFAGIFGNQIAFYRLLPGTASFSYTLEDGSGATSSATVHVY